MATAIDAEAKIPNPNLTTRFVVGWLAQEGFVTQFMVGDHINDDNHWPNTQILPAVLAAGWKINNIYPGTSAWLFEVSPIPGRDNGSALQQPPANSSQPNVDDSTAALMALIAQQALALSASSIQLTTNLVQSLGQQSNSIASNIGQPPANSSQPNMDDSTAALMALIAQQALALSATSIQLTTNLVQSLGQQSNSIASNIGR